MPAEGEVSVSSCAIRALVVDLADIFQLGPKHLQAVKGVLKHYYPLLEAWDDTDLARALSTGGLADGIHTLLESGGVRVDSHLQDGDSNEESVENLTHSRSIKTIVTSVGEKMVDFMEEEPVRFDQAAVDILTRLKRELGCLVGAVWQSYGARALVQSAGLGELFDALVDGETQDAFGLRSYPAPDLLLKLCSNMAVSPYETVGVFSLQTGGVKAASSASFGLVVARPCPSEDVPSADLKKQTLRQGADVVVNNIREVEASMLRRWYDCGIHEDAWNLVYTSYSPESELYRQALTCVSNGYMGTRGCFEGCRVTPNQRPGSYIAGVFNSTPQDDGTPPHALLVNVPNWCLIELKIGTEGFVNPLDEELLYYQHNLSFKDGLLERSITFRSDGDRETRVDVRRLLSMKQSHVGAVEYTVTPLNYDAPIVLRSAIDGDTPFGGLEILTTQEVHRETGILLTCRAAQSGVSVVTYARHRLHRRPAGDHPEDDFNHSAVVLREATSVAEEFIFNAQCNQSYTLEKLVSVWTSNDHAPEKASEGQTVAWLEHQAVREIRHTQRFKQVYEASRQVWKELWDKADMSIEGDRLAQKMARLNTYHLLIAANLHRDTPEAGLTIKGLAGEGCGHVMWDELFQFAFYLPKFPEACRAHIVYRCQRLPQARANAAQRGYAGALYPWHSADTGEEVSRPRQWIGPLQDWESFHRCYHVNHAIFFNCWNYFKSTNAADFLEHPMLEMMLEIVMFWQSVAELADSDGRYHIRGVVGPNTFHRNNNDGVVDNAYTNVMTVWCFGKVPELLDAVAPEVRARVCGKVGLTTEVLARVRDIHGRMCVHFTEEGVPLQFEGYDKLERFDFEKYTREELTHLKDVLTAEGLTPEQFALDKQPDTLMLYYLLGPKEVRDLLLHLGYEIRENATEYLRKTFAYYCQRTLHAMPLSFTILAKVGQLCWKTDYVWDWFMEGVKADLFNREGTTPLGVHLAHMAATLDIVFSTFVGLQLLDDAIVIEPSLPPTWTKVRFRRILNGSWYSIIVTKKKVKLTLEIAEVTGTPQLPISIGGNKLILCPWSSVGVKYHKMSTMKEFYDLMSKTKFVRQAIVNAFVSEAVSPAIQSQIEALRHVLETLEKVPSNEQGLAQVGLDARKRINLDLTYEITELRKDICFLQDGPEALYNAFMRNRIEDFDALVAAGVEFLGAELCHFQALITDRDGTINNYCGRYKSSIQSAYNSIFLTKFATMCCRHASILTAAPLQDMLDVSVNPDNILVYAASKGREFLDTEGHYQTAPMDAQQKALLKKVNLRLKQLVETSAYQKFALIGSGLQFKFGQSTVSRQDVSGSISPGESDEFLKVVKKICEEVSPEGSLVVYDTGLDIEILPRLTKENQAESATFHKGKGLEFLNERLGFDVRAGPNLVCGDTSSDVPMVESAMALCPDKTYVIFVTKDKQLIGRVHAICPRTLIVPSPDVLVTIMFECARLRDRNRLRGRSFSEEHHVGVGGRPYSTSSPNSSQWNCMSLKDMSMSPKDAPALANLARLL